MASVHILFYFIYLFFYHRDNSQIPFRYLASEPDHKLVRELVCDVLASC